MQKLFFLLFILTSIFRGFSQIENTNKSIRIERSELNIPNNEKSNLFTIPEIKGLTNKPNNLPQINLDTPNDDNGIEIKRDVVDPTWDIKQKFSENYNDVSKYSRDYYLGDIKTKSKFIRIVCRDHEYEDGDRIKLVLNSATIHPNIILRNSGYIIDIKLKEGLNTIEFYALNEGTSSPNTAELKVLDDNDIIIGSGQWLLTTGYKARLIVLYQ